MHRLLKFWSLTRREKKFFCEAGILLLISNLCVKTIPFKHIDKFLRRHWNGRTQEPFHRADDIRLIHHSLSRTANLLWWKNLCLSQSIAAFIMLRRRGIPATIVAGVKFSEDSSIIAHAWIRTGHAVTAEATEDSAFTPVMTIGQGPLIADSAQNRAY